MVSPCSVRNSPFQALFLLLSSNVPYRTSANSTSVDRLTSIGPGRRETGPCSLGGSGKGRRERSNCAAYIWTCKIRDLPNLVSSQFTVTLSSFPAFRVCPWPNFSSVSPAHRVGPRLLLGSREVQCGVRSTGLDDLSPEFSSEPASALGQILQPV